MDKVCVSVRVAEAIHIIKVEMSTVGAAITISEIKALPSSKYSQSKLS
jgi:hypothetical protein